MIDDEMVDRYFAKIDDAGWEDLKLPERHSSHIPSTSKLWVSLHDSARHVQHQI